MLDVDEPRKLDDSDESAFGVFDVNHWGKSYDSSQNEFSGGGPGSSDTWTDPVVGVSMPRAWAAHDPAIVRWHC